MAKAPSIYFAAKMVPRTGALPMASQLRSSTPAVSATPLASAPSVFTASTASSETAEVTSHATLKLNNQETHVKRHSRYRRRREPQRTALRSRRLRGPDGSRKHHACCSGLRSGTSGASNSAPTRPHLYLVLGGVLQNIIVGFDELSAVMLRSRLLQRAAMLPSLLGVLPSPYVLEEFPACKPPA